MTVFIALFSVDPTLGRVEKPSLSQQTLMELLIEKITNRDIICGDAVIPTNITEWNGVELPAYLPLRWGVRFDQSNDVTCVSFASIRLEGSIQLEWLPLTTIECDFSHNNLWGTVTLEGLPETLTTLRLRKNKFHGTVNLTALPSGLEMLDLGKNDFTGETDFSKLPKAPLLIDISFTKLSGSVFLREGQRIVVVESNVIRFNE